jgi:hypothetical protein
MNHTITVLLAVVLLSGCVTREQIANMRAKEDIADYGPRCEKLGLKAQTPDWAACVSRYAAADR